ncbi:ribonuclease H-like domain-containing protein [Tanacetum coccineum]
MQTTAHDLGREDENNDAIITPPVPPTQQTPHTLSIIKLPILKKGEYDMWAMKIEHYLGHTNYPIWEVIQKENGPVQVLTNTNGTIRVLPPKTAEEILARERERKARTTLLMAIPKDHLEKFHKMTDAKEIFSISNSEGLHKGYDRFQSLLSQLEIHGAGVSTEDANQKFLSCSLMSQGTVGFDKTKVECFNCHKIEHFASECRSKGNQESRRRDAGNTGYKARDNGRRPTKHDEPKGYVTNDGDGVDWTVISQQLNIVRNLALMAITQLRLRHEVTSFVLKQSYANFKKLYDEQSEQIEDAIHYPIRRTFNRTTTPKDYFSYHKVNTVGDKTVSVVRGNRETAVKASADYNWRSKRHYWNKSSKYIVMNPHTSLKNKGNANSGCSQAHQLGTRTTLLNIKTIMVAIVCFGENKANKPAGPKEANHSAGTQDNTAAGNSEMEAEPTQEYCVLPIWSSYTLTSKRASEAKNEVKKPNEDDGFKVKMMSPPLAYEDQVFFRGA